MDSALVHNWGESPAADSVWAHAAGLSPSKAGGCPLLVLQAYIHDSNQDGGCYVLAGYIAKAEKWVSFSREWEALLPRHGVLSAEDRVYHFKMAEMASTEERRSGISAFERVIYSHALCEFGWGFRHEDLRRRMSRLVVSGPPFTLRPALTPFYFAFFAMMETFSTWLQQADQSIINEPVELFFDNSAEKTDCHQLVLVLGSSPLHRTLVRVFA